MALTGLFETNRSVYRSIPGIYKLLQKSVSCAVGVFDAEIVPQPVSFEDCGEMCPTSEPQKFKGFVALGKKPVL